MRVQGPPPLLLPRARRRAPRGLSAPVPPAAALLGPEPGVSLARAIERGTAQARLLERLSPAELRAAVHADPSPLPTAPERGGYYEGRDLTYWLSGLGDALLAERVAAERGRPLAPGATVVDLGCGSGRVLRHLAGRHPSVALRGFESDVRAAGWTHAHLPAAAHARVVSPEPPLPLPDASADVVLALSVFTELEAAQEEAWLGELRRVLAPGGFALVSFHPDRIWPDLADPDHLLRRVVLATPHRVDPPGADVTGHVLAGPMPGPRVTFRAIRGERRRVNVIHDAEWLARTWGARFSVERRLAHAHGGHQDAVVLS